MGATRLDPKQHGGPVYHGRLFLTVSDLLLPSEQAKTRPSDFAPNSHLGPLAEELFEESQKTSVLSIERRCLPMS